MSWGSARRDCEVLGRGDGNAPGSGGCLELESVGPCLRRVGAAIEPAHDLVDLVDLVVADRRRLVARAATNWERPVDVTFVCEGGDKRSVWSRRWAAAEGGAVSWRAHAARARVGHKA